MASEVCPTTNDRLSIFHIGFYTLVVLATILLGYFLYGGVDGAIAVATVNLVAIILAVMIGMIPFVGVVIYLYLSYQYIFPYLIDITPINSMDWLMWIIYILSALISLTTTYIITYILIKSKTEL